MTEHYRKLIIAGAILVALLVFYLIDGHKYFSIKALKAHHELLQAFVGNHTYLAPLLFILLYIVCIALCIPAETILSLLGGFLFPQPLSTLCVIFAATSGAILVFLITRRTLAGLLRKKNWPFLIKVESEFKNNVVSYLLFLRFVHIIPFWAINLAPACFGVSLRTFAWTTLAGVIPTSIMLTLIGGELQDMLMSTEPFSMASLLNLRMEIALAMLGVLALIPVVLKKLRKV